MNKTCMLFSLTSMVLLVAVAIGEEWPTFHYDNTRTGSSSNTAPSNILLIHSYNVGGAVYSSPVVSGGYMYVGSKSDSLYQLNASNISQLIASYLTGGDVYGSPAVSGGYVYVGSYDFKLYRLNASNVNQLMESYTTGDFIESSPVVAGGYVYIGSDDNSLYQLNASNVSQLIASYATTGDITTPPAVSGKYVYVGSTNRYLYQLNASNVSQLIASYYTGGTIRYSAPAVSGGYVYVGNYDDHKLYQLNASNVSQLIATYNTGGYIYSSPAVSGGYVYVGSNDNILYQLNASNVSQLIASYTVVGGIESSPAVAGGYVYVGSNGNDKIYQLNASNVSLLIASYLAANHVYRSSPAVADEYVYIGCSGNLVYQLGVTNTAPTFSVNPTIVPATAYTGTSLNCTWTLKDAEQSFISANVTWYKNGVQNSSFDVTQINCTNATICGASTNVTGTVVTESWICSVNGYDRHVSTGYTNSSARTISNSAPSIDDVTTDGQDSPSVNPTEAGDKTITIEFNVTDADGVSNIDLTSAYANDTTDSIKNSSCIWSDYNSGNTREIACQLTFSYYTSGGVKSIKVYVEDNSDASSINSAHSFTVNTIYVISVNVSTLQFGTIGYGTNDNTAALRITNTGNGIVDLTVAGSNLANGSYVLGIGNCSVDDDSVPGEGIETGKNEMVLTSLAQSYSPTGGLAKQNTLDWWFFLDVPIVQHSGTYASVTDWEVTSLQHT